MRKTGYSAAVLIAAAATTVISVRTTVSRGEVVFRDNFENVPGATAPFPQSGVDADPVAQVGSWTTIENVDEETQVSKDYTPPEGTQCLVSNRTSGAIQNRLTFSHAAPNVASDALTLSFKYRDMAPDYAFGGTVDIMEVLGYTGNTVTWNGQAFDLRIFKGWSADGSRVYVGFGGNGSLGAPENNGYFVTSNPDTNWQQVDVVFNFVDHTYTFKMNGAALPGTTDIPFDGDAATASQLQQVLFYHYYSANSRWALDDITVSTPGVATGSGTWNVDASGDWNSGGNWSGGLPNGADLQATLGGIITAPRTVYSDAAITLGYLKFDNANGYQIAGQGSLTMQVSAGAATVEVVQGSHKINLPSYFASDTSITVGSGGLLTISDPMTIRAGKTVSKSGGLVIESPLTLEAGATLVTASGPTSVFGAPSLGAGAKIDLKNTALTVDYRGQASPATTIKGQIAAAGIMSSSATATTGLGWKDDAASQSVLVKYTYLGDTNLDGQVDVIDLGNLATAWQTSGVWVNGDSNYDDFVDVIDLGLLATNWQAGVGSPLGPGSLGQALGAYGLPSVSVPEPASVGLIGLAAAGLLRNRRGSKRR